MSDIISHFLSAAEYQQTSSKINNLPQRAGFIFEDFINNYLYLLGFKSISNDKIPDNIKIKYNIPPKGEAIDGILSVSSLIPIDQDVFHPYQIKFTTHDKLDDDRLTKFYKRLPQLFQAGMKKPAYIITNADSLNSECLPDVTIIGYEYVNKMFERYLIDRQDRQMNNTSKFEIVIKNLITPDTIQYDIIRKNVTELVTNSKCVNILPCGFGKTVISIYTLFYLYRENILGKFLFLVPTLVLLKQFHNVFMKICESHSFPISFANCLLVGSLGEIDSFTTVTTSDEVIDNFMKNTSPGFVFCTYNSCEKILNYQFNMAIFDECHLTAGKPKKVRSLLVDHGNINKRLFMTAVPRVGKILPLEVIDDGQSQTMMPMYKSMDSEEDYGKIIVNYNFQKGIEFGRLVKYKIICLVQDIITTNQTNTNVIFDDKTSSYDDACINMLEMGVRGQYHQTTSSSPIVNENDKCHKIMVFTSNHGYASALKQKYSELYPDRKVLYPGKSCNTKIRDNIIKQFKESVEPVVLISCYIFLLGFDETSCDTILFHRPKTSVMSIVQAFGRSLRKSSSNPDKVAKILVPYITESTDDKLFDPNRCEFKKLRKLLCKLSEYDKNIIEHFSIEKLDRVGGTSRKSNVNNVDINIETLKLLIFSPFEHNYKYYQGILRPLKLRNKEEYLSLAEKYAFPLNPEELFGSKIFKWEEYLGHDASEYYNLTEIRSVIRSFICNNFHSQIMTEKPRDDIYNSLRKNNIKIPWYPEDIYATNKCSLFPNDDIF